MRYLETLVLQDLLDGDHLAGAHDLGLKNNAERAIADHLGGGVGQLKTLARLGIVGDHRENAILTLCDAASDRASARLGSQTHH